MAEPLLIACTDCGAFYRWRMLAAHQRACCVRCGAELYRASSDTAAVRPATLAALSLTAVLLFLLAQCCAIVTLEVGGRSSATTLAQAVAVLWRADMQVVAVIVACCGMVCPGLELFTLLYVALGLARGRVLPGFAVALRLLQCARYWSMTHVLMIGILIALGKMTSLSHVMPHAGLFAFAGLTILFALVGRYEAATLWALADSSARPAQPLIAPISCASCTLVNPGRRDLPGPEGGCRRCGAPLHRRVPHGIALTWAALAAAALLYLPANVLPVMYTQAPGGIEADTILSGIVYFWNSGSPALAIIILVASIVVPIAKLVALAWLNASVQLRSPRAPAWRTRLYRAVELVGPWSMLDVFVITLTVGLVRFQALATVTAGPGALAFGCVVVLTMVAAAQFDPRRIWDPLDDRQARHA